MKKVIFNITAIFCLSLVLSSCEKVFDDLEGDLTKLTGENMVSTEAGIQRLLAQVYSYLPITAFPNNASFAATANSDQYTMNAVDSHGGDYGFTNTAFYGMNGFTLFGTTNTFGSSTTINWAGIRAINSFIDNVNTATTKGILTESQGNGLIAEARFVRAYCYFAMVRAWGGVPIITEVLDKYYDGKGNTELKKFAVRATEKETWDFVISELDAAAEVLPATRSDYRATKWSAYGLQARVALYAASVSKYWTKQGTLSDSYSSVASKKTYMEASYAPAYYAKCISACEAIIGSGSFSLYGANPASIDEAVANLGNLFTGIRNEELIFGKSLNDGAPTSGSNWDVFNSPQQTVSGTSQCGRYCVTLDLVDEYDDYDVSRNAVDGKVKTRVDNLEDEYMPTPVSTFPSQYTSINYIKYNNIDDPFKNKDARFKAWVIYPNSQFRGTTIKIQGGIIKTDGTGSVWTELTENYNGQTYYAFGDAGGKVSGFYNYTNVNAGNTTTTGFSLRKYLNPTAAQLYTKSFWYDIRYAEILLSYCEAVVESNTSEKFDLAEQYLNDIRHRAAFTDDVALTIDEVLHQRRLELAFESDYNYTLHRRRSFYNQNTDPVLVARRHALTPVIDLRDLPGGGTPKYIFVRSVFFQEDVGGTSPTFHTNYVEYYKSMPEYGVNGYEPNPIDE